MAEDTAAVQRRLAAILSADVVGYSGLMEADEAGTLARLKANRRDVFDPCVARHGGRIVKLMGDGALVEFASAVAAVECAVSLQAAMAQAEPDCDPAQRLRYRIGVNLGDVIVEGDDIYGDGVNVAARLQALAPAGGVAVSRVVRDQIEGKLAASFEDFGAHTVKNIHRPVQVYLAHPAPQVPRGLPATVQLSTRWKYVAGAGVVLLTLALIAVLWSGGTKPAQPALLAVLPFDNLSPGPDTQFFADGLSEELLNEFMRLDTIHVVARSSSFQFRGDKKGAAAKALGATYIIDGSVRREADRVSVSAQLVDTAANRTLWSRVYERPLGQILLLQRDVAGEITAALDLRIAPHPQAAIDPKAYDQFLRARDVFRARRAEALPELEKAVALAPDFARAWSTLAAARAIAAVGTSLAGDTKAAGVFAEGARDAANRALAIDPQDGQALGALAMTAEYLGRFAEAGMIFERAMKAEPNDTQVMNWYAGFLAQVGRIGEATAMIERAFERDRLTQSVRFNAASSLYAIGRVDEAYAIASLDSNATSKFEIDRTYLFEARRWRDLAQHLASPPPDAGSPAYLALARDAAAALGSDDAQAVADMRQRWRTFDYRGERDDAEYLWEEPTRWLAALDDLDGVFAILDKTFDPKARLGSAGPNASFLFDRLFVRVRRDARFVAVMANWGLFDYWRKTDRWPDFCSEQGLPYDCKTEAQKLSQR